MNNSAQDGVFHKTVLDGGIRVVTESMPNIRSLAVGVWFETGSRDESEDLSGISHFLEHMNFKGTPKRNAATIVREIEGHGGVLNAFTSKEVTCYHARVIDSQLTRAVNVLSDITQNSIFDEAELTRERKVIVEELKNLEDTPDDRVFEYFIEQVFPGHPMGRSILGTRDSLAAIDRARMIRYRKHRYLNGGLVIAAAGNVPHQRLVDIVKRNFEERTRKTAERKPPAAAPAEAYRQDLHANTQQAHICLGFRGYPYRHPNKYRVMVLNTLLGGGMSSRLFQKVREKRGMAYSVFSFVEAYQDTGVFGIYAGTDLENARKATSLINSEIKRLTRSPVTTGELQRTKDQLKGNLLLGLESPNSRMHRLARMEIYNGDFQSLDDVVAGIDAVGAEDILEVANDLFTGKATFNTNLLPN